MQADQNKMGQIGLKMPSIKKAKNLPVPTQNKLDFKLATRQVVLKLYKHAEPLRSFPCFCRTPFLPNKTK